MRVPPGVCTLAYMYIYVSISQPNCTCACMPRHAGACMFLSISLCMIMCVSIILFVSLAVHAFSLPIYIFTCMYICQSVCKCVFMPPKELWEAYSNRTVCPSVSPSVRQSVRPAFVSGPYLLYSLR